MSKSPVKCDFTTDRYFKLLLIIKYVLAVISLYFYKQKYNNNNNNDKNPSDPAIHLNRCVDNCIQGIIMLRL